MKTGFLFVDKPEAYTSFDIVRAVRRATDTKKCGHAGTLDPAATGLLIVAVGYATRLLRFLNLEPKTYTFEIVLGERTNTDDDEGEVVETAPTDHVDDAQISRVLQTFLGEIAQIPPVFSAIHIDGERAYVRARKGETVEMPVRHVTVHDLSLLSYSDGIATCTTTVSRGTYVRAIARDVGAKLDSVAHARKIRRTRIGDASIDSAVELEDLSVSALISPRSVLSLPEYLLDDAQHADVQHGRVIDVTEYGIGEFVSFVFNDSFLGIAERVEGGLQPRVVFPPDD